MRGLLRVSLLALAAAVLAPTAAYAQASIAGVVKDVSGAVLPGVTVEASSPVLIEKSRSVTTDGAGQYRIIDLRPGLYTVTFTLTGFTTVKREGLELTGTVVVAANAELKVGAVAETITVSGQTPVVDLQSTTRQAQITQEILADIPSSRNPFTAGVLIAGLKRGAFMSQDVGGSVVQEVASLESNNSRTADQKMMVNGVALSSMIGGGWGGGAVPNATGIAEFAIDASGVDASVATGGVRINFIPRDGGNKYAGTFFGAFATEGMASDNFSGSDAQKAGLTSASRIKGSGDFNPGAGGPLVKDKLWFFLSGRYLVADNYVAGQFFNANANVPGAFRYVSNGKQAILHQDQKMYQARLTWQVNNKNKIGSTFDLENLCSCPTGVTALQTPEASQDRRFPLQRFVQMDWSSPISSRVLLEASGIQRVERWGAMHLQTGKGDNVPALTPGIVSITDNPSLATNASLTYGSNPQFNNSWNTNFHYRAALSYITGTHSFKVGFNNAWGHYENTTYTDPTTPYSENFALGVPQSLTYRITPRTVQVNVDMDLGLFAQDRWTLNRWTLFGGIRYDHFKNSFPPQSIAPTALAPFLNVSYPEIKNLNWQDVTPKLGATYDLFGNGRTAVKVTLNKYLEGLGTTGSLSDPPNPINRLAGILTNSTRSWNDVNSFPAGDPRNGNFKPDCDLLNYNTNGECGPLTNAAIYGTFVPGLSYDSDLLNGWGRRGYNWEFTAGVQQELTPRWSLEAQYARRWYGNFVAYDDLAVSPADYTKFTMTTPVDSRLPGGGGQTLTGFDLSAAGFATAQNVLATRAQNYGNQSEMYNGANFGVKGRFKNSLLVQGGIGTGRVVTDDCDIVSALPETLHQFLGLDTRTFVFAARPLEQCHRNNGFRTAVKGLASYTIPRIDVLVSGTLQNEPGPNVVANANVCSGAASPACSITTTALGRGFSGSPFRVFGVVNPGDLYLERMNQLDVRVAKIFRYRTTRTSVNFDFYNVLNGASALTENQTYSATIAGPGVPGWRTPTSMLLARLFKVSAQFDF
jgi:hypothetical protein